MNQSQRIAWLALLLTALLSHAELLTEPTEVDKGGHWRGGAAATILGGGVGSVDSRYERSRLPRLPNDHSIWKATAWRGERVNGQFVIWTGQGLTNVRLSATAMQSETGAKIGTDNLVLSWVRYTSINKQSLFPDILEPNRPIDVAPSTARPIWLGLNVPQDTAVGMYKGQLTVTADGGHEKTFDLEVDVLPATLPPVAEWSALVEIFPNPYALAEAQGLELWSADFWVEMKKLLTLSADAGVNAHMTYLAPVVWADTDPRKNMLRPIKKADGTWTYDFDIIDRYIELGLACGLNREIKFAFPRAPIPTIHYFDEARNEWVTEEARFRSPQYEAFWHPLVTALAAHLKEKGWYDKSYLYFDEPKGSLQYWLEMAKKLAPDFKIAVAGGDAGRNLPAVQDASIILHEKFEPDQETLLQREKAGQQTTFYICNFPKAPNTLAWNKPVEGVWMGWYAAGRHYTGFLRWALNNWTDLINDPFIDISTGDFQLTYPGARSSVRLERLREGFQDYEKIQLVRRKLQSLGPGATDALSELNAVLGTFRHDEFKADYGRQVQDGRANLEKLARTIY